MKLQIRAEADERIGTGHVMRCLALAQAWQDAGGTVTLVAPSLPAALEGRLRRESVDVVRGAEASADWIAVDGYHFDAAYQARLHENGARVLWIDDEAHAAPYVADLVLNQNLHARETMYAERSAHTRLLLGPRYALIRRELLNVRRDRRPGRVLVTMGGGDPENITGKVIDALRQIGDVDPLIVAGAANPHVEALRRSGFRVEHDPSDMPELMASAEIAVSAGGSTSWELAFLGVPNVIVSFAGNQRPVAERLAAAGVAVDLGPHAPVEAIRDAVRALLDDPRRAESMSARGCALVDGRGASRVVAVMRGQSLPLRDATIDDARTLFEWASDESVRASAFSTEPIAWESHVAWLQRKLADPGCRIYIVDGVGQIRFDIDGDRAVTDVSVAREQRGRGLARQLIASGSQELFTGTAVQQIDAYVREENTASRRAFAAAGFEEIGPTNVRGARAVHFAMRRMGER